jgi:hypothetical protein
MYSTPIGQRDAEGVFTMDSIEITYVCPNTEEEVTAKLPLTAIGRLIGTSKALARAIEVHDIVCNDENDPDEEVPPFLEAVAALVSLERAREARVVSLERAREAGVVSLERAREVRGLHADGQIARDYAGVEVDVDGVRRQVAAVRDERGKLVLFLAPPTQSRIAESNTVPVNGNSQKDNGE